MVSVAAAMFPPDFCHRIGIQVSVLAQRVRRQQVVRPIAKRAAQPLVNRRRETGLRLVDQFVGKIARQDIPQQPLPDIAADIPALMKIDTPSSLATHSYRFEVEKNGNRHRYATITEIHHPDYLTPHELSAMYPGGN